MILKRLPLQLERMAVQQLRQLFVVWQVKYLASIFFPILRVFGRPGWKAVPAKGVAGRFHCRKNTHGPCEVRATQEPLQ